MYNNKNAANCKKMLDSTNVTKHDDELFCRSCYGKKFGPKGYGYGGGGAGVLSMDDGTGYIVPIFTLSFIFSLKPFLGFIFLFHESWDVSTRKYDESRMRTLDRTDPQHRISRNWHKLT
jgi:hypothetical protein